MPTTEKVTPVNISATSRSIMVIDAKARANDILSAYEFFKHEKPTYQVSARTYGGQIISNILDLTAMPSGTWLILHLSTMQGVKTQIFSVEEISELFYP
jgi:hypothetical protein